MITLKKLGSDDPDIPVFREINNEAFPDYERLPIEKMFAFSPCTDVVGYYDGETPVGFSMLVKGKALAYMYFFAIRKEYRGKGFGSGALKLLLREYPEYQIVLDFEELLPEADNFSQRTRRKEFYLRNGFYETGRYTFLDGYRFEVVCSGKDMNTEELISVIKTIHARVPEFGTELA